MLAKRGVNKRDLHIWYFLFSQSIVMFQRTWRFYWSTIKVIYPNDAINIEENPSSKNEDIMGPNFQGVVCFKGLSVDIQIQQELYMYTVMHYVYTYVTKQCFQHIKSSA